MIRKLTVDSKNPKSKSQFEGEFMDLLLDAQKNAEPNKNRLHEDNDWVKAIKSQIPNQKLYKQQLKQNTERN